MRRLAYPALAVAAGSLGLWALHGRPTEAPPSGGVTLVLASPSPPFARAVAPHAFRWPEDHGPHPAFRTEWWYYTGNLGAKDGRAFGYQLTIFRRGLTPGPPPARGLATNQIYFAHFALTDARRGVHVAAERWSRGAAGLAGAGTRPFKVFVEDWGIEASGPDPSRVRLRARHGNSAVDLALERTKPLVLQGDQGLSAKSAEPGNASYYVSATRVATHGVLVSGGEEVPVSGESWFDHEWSTSALAPDAVGWDWFSLQLDDASEMMFFRIRRTDGTADPASSGTVIRPSGATLGLRPEDVDLRPLGTWLSPRSGARYPAGWSVDVPRQSIHLTVEPLLSDQEVRLSFTYWEGAVRVTGARAGRPVSGHGYVELTGYAAPMRQLF
jgi:predicted secreted hydrolase